MNEIMEIRKFTKWIGMEKNLPSVKKAIRQKEIPSTVIGGKIMVDVTTFRRQLIK